jgi:competence ComEA-like helix-hairpin-helix protein
MKRETNNLLIGMVAGAIVGAASALLFAPSKGEETRTRLKEQAERARQRATETSHQLQSQIDVVKQRASEASARVRETVSTARERARQMAVAGKLNLNTATKEELIIIEGINPALADDIIVYREEHGGFRNLDELDEVYSLGKTVMSKIRDRLTT